MILTYAPYRHRHRAAYCGLALLAARTSPYVWDPSQFLPRAPVMDSNEPIAFDRARILWSFHHTNAQSFIIERRQGPDGVFEQIAEIPFTGSAWYQHIDNRLMPVTMYQYRVCAHNFVGNSEWSAGDMITTPGVQSFKPPYSFSWETIESFSFSEKISYCLEYRQTIIDLISRCSAAISALYVPSHPGAPFNQYALTEYRKKRRMAEDKRFAYKRELMAHNKELQKIESYIARAVPSTNTWYQIDVSGIPKGIMVAGTTIKKIHIITITSTTPHHIAANTVLI